MNQTKPNDIKIKTFNNTAFLIVVVIAAIVYV